MALETALKLSQLNTRLISRNNNHIPKGTPFDRSSYRKVESKAHFSVKKSVLGWEGTRGRVALGKHLLGVNVLSFLVKLFCYEAFHL